ncbi:MAG: AmmeMemoRadiSam system protein A [Candidatus Promineifilaceae bacterium]|nr:AmmeMemoRadiSam system protein A [Candidatus Promineifilaceae bacterium]
MEKQSLQIEANVHTKTTLNYQQKAELVQLARQAIQEYLSCGTLQSYSTDDPMFCKKLDVFVTLWTTSNDPMGTPMLRGCVGRLGAQSPLYASVRDSAVSAATQDPRFPPVTPSELDSIRIEVAILSPYKKIGHLHEIEIGKHGIMIEGVGQRALLLPKVATRLGLNQLSFYHALCDKANLAYSCWPSSASLYIFSAITINE